LLLPEELDVFMGGGRGGGKSYGLALLILRHVEQYGAQARVLYVRKSYAGLSDFELLTRELFGKVYGTAARYNGSEHTWKFPNGGYCELAQLENHGDFAKFQGRSFSTILVDEAGQYADPSLLDLLRSNLRGPQGMPTRTILCANPGGCGHQWLAQRFVFKAAPWRPFLEEKSGRQFVYAPSTLDGNIFIDRASYKAQIEAATCDDPELMRAWIDGDWSVARGAFFASVLEEKRNAVDPWQEIPEGWSTFLSHDWGSAAPSCTLLIAESPGAEGPDGRWYPKDSLVVVDEFVTHKPGNLNVGLGWVVPTVAHEIVAMCRRWGVPAAGCADDACFSRQGSSAGSIAEEFRRAGVTFEPAKKADRATGWQILRRLLADAGQPDVPGLYIARNCEFLWATLPTLPRDVRRIEDVDSSANDHGADSLRYGALRLRWAKTINLKTAV